MAVRVICNVMTASHPIIKDTGELRMPGKGP